MVCLTDEHSRDPQIYSKLNEDDDRPIESISDLDINKINELMFGDLE